MGIDPRVHRYRSSRPDDAVLRSRLRELSSERRRFGYRRLHILLEREGWKVNWKKLYRIYREERLIVRKRGSDSCRSPETLPPLRTSRTSSDRDWPWRYRKPCPRDVSSVWRRRRAGCVPGCDRRNSRSAACRVVCAAPAAGRGPFRGSESRRCPGRRSRRAEKFGQRQIPFGTSRQWR